MVSVCSWLALASRTLTRLFSLAPGRDGDVLELGDDVGAAELGGPEPGLGRVGAQVAQQRFVVHPVHGRLGVGVEHRVGSGGQRQKVAFLPPDQVAVDRRKAPPVQHVVQLAGGVRAGVDLLTGADAQEVGQQRRAGRGTVVDTQLLGQIQRHHTGRLVQVDLWPEPDDRHLRRVPRANRVGGLGVLEHSGRHRPTLQTGPRTRTRRRWSSAPESSGPSCIDSATDCGGIRDGHACPPLSSRLYAESYLSCISVANAGDHHLTGRSGRDVVCSGM